MRRKCLTCINGLRLVEFKAVTGSPLKLLVTFEHFLIEKYYHLFQWAQD